MFLHKEQSLLCFGPGRKRYLIALLCTIGLTVVIGMRSEMIGIINNLSANHSRDSRVHKSNIFKYAKHRDMPWTHSIVEDLLENSLFFGYLVASPICGLLTVRHDASLVLGGSVAMTCGMNLFLPFLETMSSEHGVKVALVVLLRFLQGCSEGGLIPAVFGTLRFWMPASEASTLLCLAVIGVSLGPLIGLPLCAEIEEKCGWSVVFYIYANLGLVWCIFWWRWVDEKPMKDRALHKTEREFLHRVMEPRVWQTPRHLPIPWRRIFTSRRVLALCMAYAADDWTFQISSVCMQSFYQQVYNTEVRRTISLLAFPFLARSICVPLGGLMADMLLYKFSLTSVTVRQLMVVLGFGMKALFFAALAYARDEMEATCLLTLALGFSGFTVAGYAVNIVEMSPQYCGLLMGVATGISTGTGILSTVVASYIVTYFSGSETHIGWKLALLGAAMVQVAAMSLYLLWAGSQPSSGQEAEDETAVEDEEDLTEGSPGSEEAQLPNEHSYRRLTAITVPSSRRASLWAPELMRNNGKRISLIVKNENM